jgi:hypothetical protein
MKNIKIKNLLKSKVKRNVIILIASMILVYSLISLYFINHCFFNTVINGADVSLKAHHEVEDTIRSSIRDYKLQLVEKNGEIEEIIGQDIGMLYNEQNNISKVYQMQRSYKWINSL